ncbi:hypothetical protein [Morganella psychrotolerans]|uniref:Uncharacterized protein n=1 Tax=Morganella psychrotolerans TaxID=368603 RepID=A0A1B8HTW7_9GAMM|nr:hypothetical protein [Morganella psychrotolerans]OBU13314.1 hypothetical protein AYY18_00765 [Morganella psychrotolerans]
MANKNKLPEKKPEGGGLPPELMVPGQEIPAQEPDNGPDGDGQGEQTTAEQGADPESGDGEKAPESDQDQDSAGIYVVVKGRCVQHDGVMYHENQQIAPDEDDVARLLSLGVIMTLEAVQAKLAKANPPGTVTINGR